MYYFRHPHHLIFGFLVALQFVACSRNDSNTINYENNAEMQRALDNWQLKCSGSNCNSSVGQLVTVVGNQSVELCTGFVAGDSNTFITNDHCLSMYQTGEVCEGRSYIYFNRNAQTVRVDCRSVVMRTNKEVNLKLKKHSHGFEDYPDIGVLKIDGVSFISKVQSRVLLVDDEGVGDSQSLFGYVVDPPTEPDAAGYMRKINCEVSSSVSANTENKWPSVSGVALQKCNLRKGNSGSPLFNEKGNVAAIVFGINKNNVLLATNSLCLGDLATKPNANKCSSEQ